MYSIQEISRLLKVPYSNIVRWLHKYSVSVVTGPTGKLRVTEMGLDELQSILAAKQQIKDIERTIK